LISSKDLSPCGTKGKLFRRKCPLLSKKERYISRSSFSPVHFIVFVSFLDFGACRNIVLHPNIIANLRVFCQAF